MSDLISRQAAIDAVYERIKQIGYENSLPILSIGQAIRDLPSAEKTGTWIRHERGLFFGYKCSQCGELSEIPTDYCPHCGRLMRGGE